MAVLLSLMLKRFQFFISPPLFDAVIKLFHPFASPLLHFLRVGRKRLFRPPRNGPGARCPLHLLTARRRGRRGSFARRACSDARTTIPARAQGGATRTVTDKTDRRLFIRTFLRFSHVGKKKI